MSKTKLEKYVVIYQSHEHYEVLGYVMAENFKKAIEIAKDELNKEAKLYDVEEAKISKLKDEQEIKFDIS